MRYPLRHTKPASGEGAFDWTGEYTDEMRAFLDTHGYIRFRKFASQAEVERLREELASVEQRWIAEDRDMVNGIPIKYGVDHEGRRFVNRFAFTSHFSPWLHEWLKDDRFQKVLAICGPDFRIGEDEKDGVVVNHYLNVPGSNYTKLGWHTDALRDIFYGHLPKPMWNVGFYIDDSHREKGALRVIPGTHTQGLLPMMVAKRHFADNTEDPREVLVEADAGDLTLHDGRLWHRVALASVEGAASRRRTMYIPFLDGPVEVKNESSATPFYHRFSRKIR
jgi:phytanoyl-CoA hydroxylase